MDIIKFELKKIFTSPIVWGLIAAIIIFNGFLISAQSYRRENHDILLSMVELHGSEINEESLYHWRQKHASWMDQINEITEQMIGEIFDSVYHLGEVAFVRELDLRSIFTTREEWRILETTEMIERYYFTARDADDILNNQLMGLIQLDLESFEYVLEITGALAYTLLNQHQNYQPRLENLIASGEHQYFFFIGSDRMHELLFNEVFGAITIGITVLVILVTSFLLSYEFDNKTHLLLYATKCGRGLQIKKLISVFFATTAIVLVMTSLTLGIYFSIFDYSGLWHISMGSVFIGHIPSYSLTFLQYLLAVVGMIYVGQLLFALLIFALSKLIRSSYLTILAFFILFIIGLSIYSWFPLHSNFVFYSGFNPFYLLFRYLGNAFMRGPISESHRHLELITIGIWTVILLISAKWSYSRFKVSNL